MTQSESIKRLKLQKKIYFKIFRAVANFTKSLDPNRPITASIAVNLNDDKAVCILKILITYLPIKEKLLINNNLFKI